MRWTLAVLVGSLLGGVPLAAQTPLRVLLITGGGFHDFDRNPKLLLAGIDRHVKLAVTELRLPDDQTPDPPPDQPRPGAILDAELQNRFDVILAYHQGEKLGLNREELDNLMSFVRRGGGWVGLHCAADSWKWCRDYVAMVGGVFQSHPPFQPLTAQRVLGDHPVLAGVADFTNPDEFYYLDACSLEDKSVLLTGQGPTDQKTRPLAWTKTYGEGRVFYTTLGHGPEAHGSAAFHRLVANAIQWSAAKPHWAPGADGWRELWDGRSWSGWTQVGPGSFKIENGLLVTNGGMGMLWFHELRLRDFELEVEWQVSRAGDNSGVFVRFPNAPRTPWDAVQQGYEIQICDGCGKQHDTGSVYDFAPARSAASRPPGEWNRFLIRVVGQHYEVLLNDRKVCDYEGSRGREGFVGLQNHNANDVVSFRRVRARALEK